MSQHPGGFVLTHGRLDDLVPIEPAAMEYRQIIEWDKDDIDALKMMKVDVLGLGMLGCMSRAFNMLEEAKGLRVGLADLQDDDPGVYGMIQKADTLGTFQIESRAQMSMLPLPVPGTMPVFTQPVPRTMLVFFLTRPVPRTMPVVAVAAPQSS